MRALGCILVLMLAAPVAATPLEDRLREQLRLTVGQLNDLKASQATLEAAKASAEKERDLAKAKARPTADVGVSRELAAVRSQNAALTARAGEAAIELSTATARTNDLAARLKAAEADLAQQRAAAATSGTAATAAAATLQACNERNARLVATGRDLVALHVRRYGARKYLPLQLLRTKIETEAQAMGDRIAANAVAGTPR